MANNKKELTPRQKAAIYLHVIEGFKDKKILFAIAEGSQRLAKLKDTSVAATIAKWYNSKYIQDGILNAKYWLKAHDEEVIENYLNTLAESENPDKPRKEKKENTVNFLDLDEFLKYACEQANKINDEKERRAWVELIGKYKNFREGETEEQQQIRAYLPLSCEDCELKKRCERCVYDVCQVQSI